MNSFISQLPGKLEFYVHVPAVLRGGPPQESYNYILLSLTVAVLGYLQTLGNASPDLGRRVLLSKRLRRLGYTGPLPLSIALFMNILFDLPPWWHLVWIPLLGLVIATVFTGAQMASRDLELHHLTLKIREGIEKIEHVAAPGLAEEPS